jgi:DNA-binding transcriptional MerR regulator
MDETPPYFTIKTLCKFLMITPVTLRTWEKIGRIPLARRTMSGQTAWRRWRTTDILPIVDSILDNTYRENREVIKENGDIRDILDELVKEGLVPDSSLSHKIAPTKEKARDRRAPFQFQKKRSPGSE